MFTRVRTSLEGLLPRGLWIGPLVLAGCSMEFSGQQKDFALSETSRELLSTSTEGQEQLLGELERLFGEAAAPRFAEAARNLDPGGRLAEAPVDLSPREAAAIRAGNRERFAEELGSLERGELDSIGPWKWAPELSERWARLVDEARDTADFGERARELLTEHYPSLRDSAALYGNKCLHCHGNEGGGDGPTSYTARPFPRDFRLGIFKYDNLEDGGRPERRDLTEIIQAGIEGTAMPSMAHLSPAQLHGLADYVRFLAMRGEVEQRLAMAYAEDEAPSRPEIGAQFNQVVALWRDAPRERITAPTPAPVADAASIKRGHELFHDRSFASCTSCHGDGGRGGGPAAYGPSADDPEELVALLTDAWGHEAKPAEIPEAILRHGEDPASLYELLYLGIDGTPMAGIGAIPDKQGGWLFEDEDIWSLVHYVQALRDPRWSTLLEQLQEEAP